jgi:hypothetical protein
VIELVGPAGAGKTTLAHRLGASREAPRRRLSLWGLPRWALLASAVALVPSMVAAASRGRPLRGSELAQMIRLDALRRVVRREVRREGTLLLDEGPVFALSWLEVVFRRNGDPTLAAWRRRIVADWASLLDAVVRLDASDAAIAHRIRTRAKSHPVKHAADAEIYRFTAEFRRAFDLVLGDLAAAGSLEVMQLDTEGEPLDQSVHRLLMVVSGGTGTGGRNGR